MASKVYWILSGPRLLRIYRQDNSGGHDYVPSMLESLPDKVIQTFHAAMSMSYWTSPVLGIILYRRGYFSVDGGLSLLRIALSLVVTYVAAYVMRGIGRMSHPEYRTFINVLIAARNNPSVETKKLLQGYDFEFWAAPVDFKWNEGKIGDNKKVEKPGGSSRRAQAIERSSLPCRILSYLAMHTFGRRMVYPGSTSIMNYLLSNMLKSGRAALVEEKQGQRAKLLTEDGNEIDTMFVDRRGRHGNGTTLVITSEGNAGFYEMGCSGTAIDAGFSVLGWNHPGFGGSSGVPTPASEQKAADAVVQYAIQKLKFQPENIAVFAWSIGGYPASWIAKHYPDIKFAILDATFDDIVPLAVTKMPESWKNLVALSLRTYMDLHIAEQLLDYPGPILLIRRTRDEIITTEAPPNRPPVIASNRGNFLLLKLLQHRYPTIVDQSTLPVMKQFLAQETIVQDNMLREHDVNITECATYFTSYIEAHGARFPLSLDVGQNQELKTRLALFLIRAHMKNFESTHCTPLPLEFFQKPWVPGSRL